MSVHVVQSLAEFATLKAEWNRLAEGRATPLLWHEWLLACGATLHRECCLHVAVQREGGRLTAGAPLAVTGGGRFARLEFLGSRALGEPCGFVFEDEGALERLLRGMFLLGCPAALSRLSADSGTRAALKRAAAGTCALVVRSVAPSLAVPLGAAGGGNMREVSPRLRSDLRRASRRAAAAGAVRERFWSPGPSEVPELIERFGRLEATGWKGREGSTLLQKDCLRAFFTAMAQQMALRHALRVGCLSIDGRDAAAVLGLEAYGRVWVLKVCYDERWAGASPGLQLFDRAMRDAGARGLLAYEFLGSAEPWQERWRTERRPYIAAAVYPASLKGLVALVSDLWVFAFRRPRRRVARADGGRDEDS